MAKKMLHMRRINGTFCVGIFVLCIVFVVVMTTSSLNQNVKSRALAEVQSTVNMQASAFSRRVDEQYQALELVHDMIENHNRHFGSEGLRPTLTSIVNTFELCTLVAVDLDGNATDYLGNDLGNISDRTYFQDIVTGKTEKCCVYLENPKGADEPRVIFSIPLHDTDGVIQGVLFCSKEISVLESSLFAHSDLFDESVDIFICDESGNLIAANNNAYLSLTTGTDNDNEQYIYDNVFEWNSALSDMRQGGKPRSLVIDGVNQFVACASLGIDGWSIYCMVDEGSASRTYADSQNKITRSIIAITAVFAAALFYIVALILLYHRQRDKESQILCRNYDNYRSILKETHCAVIEYDMAHASLTPVQPELDKWDLSFLNSLDAYDDYKSQHPEFNFDELEKAVLHAAKTKKTYNLESFLTLEDQKYYWLRMSVIPVSDENKDMSRLLCAIFDVSKIHTGRETDDILETYAHIPGGVMRYNLSLPVHLEYFSDGLCSMLGYTPDEINQKIGPERSYSHLILKEDRPVYKDFLSNLSTHGGTQTFEYRMPHKDGAVLNVSDTMTVKENQFGIKYGYSIVTDLGKFKEMQLQLQKELEETKQQLMDARIKNANSQMQPHFLYNALASIREIVLDDPQYASDLIYDFTTHLRACIRTMSSDNLIPFSQELENIKAYVNIEKMRFGDRLNMVYDCPETDFDIIPLSIQPLVENAIRHGVYERGAKGGTVTVRTQRKGTSILVSVDDDGVGFDFDAVMQEVHDGKRDSNGLYNLIFRFEKRMNAHVVFKSTIGQGTNITVILPGGETINESYYCRR